MDFEKTEKGLKADRIMELFFRAIKGEALSAQKLANEYHVSCRSITRDINDLKAFLSEHKQLVHIGLVGFPATAELRVG